jgi:plastocyanin domain-containing protein
MNKKTNTTTIISIIAVVLIIIGAIYFSSSSKPKVNNTGINNNKNETVSNVSIVDGVQVIEIQAKGGYTPRKSVAKAGIPTIIRFKTSGTFDCSSSLRIPSMNIFNNLPQSGNTDVDLGTQKVGVLNGSCGMGMYPFEIDFN